MYEVIVDNGKLCYKKDKEPVDTQDEDKWIFVMSTSGKLYVAKVRFYYLVLMSFNISKVLTME